MKRSSKTKKSLALRVESLQGPNDRLRLVATELREVHGGGAETYGKSLHCVWMSPSIM